MLFYLSDMLFLYAYSEPEKHAEAKVASLRTSKKLQKFCMNSAHGM